jgi:hypothetical protein
MGSIRSPETVGDSINENTWQHLMFANSRPANLTIPELAEMASSSLNNSPSSAHLPRSHHHAIEPFISGYCGSCQGMKWPVRTSEAFARRRRALDSSPPAPRRPS